jgi:hypothetical protein
MNRATKFFTAYREITYQGEILHPVQNREIKLAFYSGMLAALLEVSNISAAAEDDDAGLNSGAQDIERLWHETTEAAIRASQSTKKGETPVQ